MAIVSRPRDLRGMTFLVCIGAAKTGTSWLHQYFQGREDVVVSPLKEVHFFDSKFSENTIGNPDRIAEARLRHHLNLASHNVHKQTMLQASLDRVQMIDDDESYFAHFQRYITPKSRIFCDITPGYSAIGTDGFAYLKDFCEARGVRVKLLFLMRDPVERLWSQIRHIQQLSPRNDAVTQWNRLSNMPAVRARADYRSIVSSLDRIFCPSDVLHLFYETLFEEPAMRTLLRFLGLPYSVHAPHIRLNETCVKLPLPAEARACFARDLAEQYHFCKARFGDDVPDTWDSELSLS